MEGVIVRLTYTAHGRYLRTGRRKEKEKIPCKENHAFHNTREEREVPPWGHSLPGILEQSNHHPGGSAMEPN